jgi:hypothetical protein
MTEDRLAEASGADGLIAARRGQVGRPDTGFQRAAHGKLHGIGGLGKRQGMP